MPIDISLLRPSEEGGNIKEVEKWQLHRLLGENVDNIDVTDKNCRHIKDSVKSLLSKICELEQEKRKSLKDCCEARHKLNQLQSSLAPIKKNRPKGGDYASKLDNNENTSTTTTAHCESVEESRSHCRQEIEHLKKVVIPDLTKDLEIKSKTLDFLLPRIMNLVIVDENQSLSETVNEIGRDFINDVNHDTMDTDKHCLDPLYCICGYEKTHIPIWNPPIYVQEESTTAVNINDGSQEKAYLCNNGVLLYDAICSHAKISVQRSFNLIHVTPEEQIVVIPQFIPLESDLAKQLLGCMSDFKEEKIEQVSYLPTMNHNGVDHTNVPSSIVLALLHKNKTFTDRELPKFYICKSQVSNECARVGLKQLPLIHTINNIEVLAMSTCNLSISVALQDDIVKSFVHFYKSLLIKDTDLKNMEGDLKSKQCKSAPLLHIETTSPSDLDPNEARRITIKGYLHSEKDYVCIGYVSNYTDFISRGVKIKCAGGNGQPVEFVHLIHGKLCDHNVLKWMLENNIVSIARPICPNHRKSIDVKMFHEGIIVPSPIVRCMRQSDTLQGLLFLPFQRDIVRGKRGKITIKEIKNAPSKVWLDMESKSELNDESNSKITSVEQNQDFKLTLPSAADEASCNPYQFLPFTSN